MRVKSAAAHGTSLDMGSRTDACLPVAAVPTSGGSKRVRVKSPAAPAAAGGNSVEGSVEGHTVSVLGDTKYRVGCDTEDQLTVGLLASGSEMTFGHTVKTHLGEGSFGTVFAAVGRDGGQIAIKHIEYTPMEVTTGNSKDQRREVEALLILKHPNIVRLPEVNRTLFPHGFGF